MWHSRAYKKRNKREWNSIQNMHEQKSNKSLVSSLVKKN